MFFNSYGLLKCSKCENYLDKPFECVKCYSIYCSKCVDKCNNKNCKCEEFHLNKAIKKILDNQLFLCYECKLNFKKKEELIEHNKIYHNKINKCKLCSIEFYNIFEFLEHIYYNHKNKILDFFDENSMYNQHLKNSQQNLKNKKINLNNIQIINDNESLDNKEIEFNINNDSNYLENNSFNESEQSRIDNESKISNLEKKSESNIINTELSKINRFKNSSDVQSITIDDFSKTISYDNFNSKYINPFSISIAKYYRCGEKVLKCNCCIDKICKEGNCFCLACMKINLKNNNLFNKLINKEDRVCTYSKGKYYCGVKFKCDNLSVYGHSEIMICKYPRECPACKDLNQSIKLYIK